jgi:hypothetical protein
MRRKRMLDWIAEKVLNILSVVPALFVEKSSPNFALVRAAFALLLIVLVVYLMSVWPAIRGRIRFLLLRKD